MRSESIVFLPTITYLLRFVGIFGIGYSNEFIEKRIIKNWKKEILKKNEIDGILNFKIKLSKEFFLMKFEINTYLLYGDGFVYNNGDCEYEDEGVGCSGSDRVGVNVGREEEDRSL